MIQYLKHSQINKEKWDDCIVNSHNGIIYAYSDYLDIVSPGWEALIEGDYKKVMPLTRNKKYGIEYLYQPYLAQQLGVFSDEEISEAAVLKFLNAIPSKFKFIDIRLNQFNKVKSDDFKITESITCELDLNSSYEIISKKYAENTKRNIKKAWQNELVIQKGNRVKELIEIFKKTRGFQLKKIKENVYHTLELLINNCIQKKSGEVWEVTNKENKLIAGAFFIKSNAKVIFIFSSADNEAKEKGAMFLLIDRFIYANSNTNLTLDFEGSNLPDLARFYKGFSAKECVYLQVKKNKLPFILNRFKK